MVEAMYPVIEDSLSKVGAVEAYNNVMGKFQSFPFVQDIKANLTNHVAKKGVDGIFHYIAEEEAAIRKDPLKQTTEILKKVFFDPAVAHVPEL